MVPRAGPICSSIASIERGSAVRSGVLSLDQQSAIGAFQEDACLREAMSGTMVDDDGGAQLVLAAAGDQTRPVQGIGGSSMMQSHRNPLAVTTWLC